MKADGTSGEPSQELVDLVNAWCNRQADEGEVKRLEEILWQSPQARHYYRRAMNVHAELHARCEGGEGAPSITPLPRQARSRSGGAWAWVGWAVAAMVTLFFAGWVATHVPEKPALGGANPAPGKEAPDPTIGLMVNESGALFEGMKGNFPILFESGEYVLKKGIVHFRLTNGVDVVMRGPARFGIRDAMNMRLHNGVIRAMVPESGQGFIIEAPQMLYEDLGTEFGLAVGEGKSEMYVFNGQVNARKPGKGEVVSSVFQGESLRQEGEEVTVDRSLPGVEFPSPEDIGFEDWRARQPSAILSEGLIAYFPFTYDPARPEVLENVVTMKDGRKVVADATIKGARWVSGRWARKDALLFDREGDCVELEIPGEFDAISMSAWIDIDRLDHAVNAIFTSNGWSPGDLHWQVLRTQEPLLAVHEIHERGSLLKRPIRLGRWIHLVAVLSKESGRTRYYVDGQLAQENSLPIDALITPGRAQIGDWLQEAPDPFPKRSLKAKIDEFAIWNRALSEEEVQTLTRSGVPSLLLLAERLEALKSPHAGASFSQSREVRD